MSKAKPEVVKHVTGWILIDSDLLLFFFLFLKFFIETEGRYANAKFLLNREESQDSNR